MALRFRGPGLPKMPGAPAKRTVIDRRSLAALLRLTFQLTVRRPNLARLFWRNVIDIGWHNPGALEQTLMCMALYLHLGPFSRYVVRQLDRHIAELAAEQDHGATVGASAAESGFARFLETTRP
jgi:hypothetical protein